MNTEKSNKKEPDNGLYTLLATVFTESEKAKMASEWSRSRSVGNRDQDRDCYYDYLMGIEAAVRKIQNGG